MIFSSSPLKDIIICFEPKFFQVSQVRQGTNASLIRSDKRNYIWNRIQSNPASSRHKISTGFSIIQRKEGPPNNLQWLGLKGENVHDNYPLNLVLPDKYTAEKRILFLVVVAAPEPFWFLNTVNANSTIYINQGTEEKENGKFFTSLVRNREIEQKIIINLTWASEASNPKQKRTRLNATSSRRLLVMKWDSQ